MNYKKIIKENKNHYLEELFEVIRQKSISAQNEGIEECAHLVAGKMSEAGVSHVEIIEGGHYPVVYGEHIVSPDAVTLLIYGHYDVQPRWINGNLNLLSRPYVMEKFLPVAPVIIKDSLWRRYLLSKLILKRMEMCRSISNL